MTRRTTRPCRGLWIHGKTGQPFARGPVPAGTVLTETKPDHDCFGEEVTMGIDPDGFWLRVPAGATREAEETT